MADERNDARAGANPISLLQGLMGAAAMKAALDLEIFTHIANGADSAEKISAAKHLPLRSTRILCDALVALEVVAKSDGRYSLPPLSQALLVKGSPTYAGGMANTIGSRVLWNEAGRLTDVVKAGPFLQAFLFLIVIPLALAWATQAWGARKPAGQKVSGGMTVLMVPLMAATLLTVVASQVPKLHDNLSDVARVIPFYALFLVGPTAMLLEMGMDSRRARFLVAHA